MGNTIRQFFAFKDFNFNVQIQDHGVLGNQPLCTISSIKSKFNIQPA